MAICKNCNVRTGIYLEVGVGLQLKSLFEGTEYDVNSDIIVDNCSQCEDEKT